MVSPVALLQGYTLDSERKRKGEIMVEQTARIRNPTKFKGPDYRINLGRNIECCLRIIDRSVDSLARRTDIQTSVLLGFARGNSEVRDEWVEAIASDFGITTEQLLWDYGGPENRTNMLRNLFRKQGPLVEGESHIDVKAPHVALVPKVAEPKPTLLEHTSVTKGANTVQEKKERRTTDDGIWNQDDLTATLGGRVIHLQDKVVRAQVIRRVREVAARSGITLTRLMKRINVNKQVNWFRLIEMGSSRIYGTQIESIAEVCKTTVEYLLTGRRPVSAEDALMEERHEAPIVLPAVVDIPRPKPVAPLSAPVIVLAPSMEEAPDSLPEPFEEEHLPQANLPPAGAVLETLARPSLDQEYFQARFLSESTEPATGVKIGLLLKQASGQGELDWATAYFTLTKEGAELKSDMDKFVATFQAYPTEIRNVLFQMITGGEK